MQLKKRHWDIPIPGTDPGNERGLEGRHTQNLSRIAVKVWLFFRYANLE